MVSHRPHKWLIAGLSYVGLTKNLKRCDKFAIEKARIAMQFKRAEEKMQAQPTAMHAHVEAMKARLAQEYEHYSKALQDWAKLKRSLVPGHENAIKNGETLAAYKAKFKAMEVEMRLQRKRLQALVRQVQKPALAA